MENIFEELGIPKKYLKKTIKDDRYIALVHKQWLKSLVKHYKLTEFIQKQRLENWSTIDDETTTTTTSSWMKIFITVYMKRDLKVIPLPRIRPQTNTKLEHTNNTLMFSQLMQYISQKNYQNLWKEAYKKYTSSNDANKETQICLNDYNDVLREILIRIYGCQIINTQKQQINTTTNDNFDVHLNILPCICGIETLNAIFMLHIPYIEHNLNDCVTFSPAILDKCYTKPLFIVYQLLNILKSLHDRSLTLGNITLNDIYLTEDMWLYIFPQIHSNIYIQDIPKNQNFTTQSIRCTQQLLDCRKIGHKFENYKCIQCGIKTYDTIQITYNESLDQLCQYWLDGQISNFTYISALNQLSGRKLGDPNCHYVFPWVTDFSTRSGKNWRDLKKSKYRLNKGDRQLDLTYDNCQTQVPHHVSDVLSSITYYVYMSRRTPKQILCKNVRTVWVPAEYPSSIQRMQEWTPDECIPEFFNDPSVFRSIHDDLDDLEVPLWAASPEDFIEKHREALESAHVSERLHYWIDLTFGYKLTGSAAIKAKNVCLQLADEHVNLTKSGIVQLFTQPHPARINLSPFWGKIPPKIYVNKPIKSKTRDRSNSSTTTADSTKSDGDDDPTSTNYRSPLGLTKILSRSRSSLHEEQNQKPIRSPSSQRSASLGPKNASFTSHVITQKPKSTTLSSGHIFLPKEYKPESALEQLEKRYNFLTRTFHTKESQRYVFTKEITPTNFNTQDEIVQNAFTNFIYTENFVEKVCRTRTTKSHTFPLDNHEYLKQQQQQQNKSIKIDHQNNDNQIVCNYSEIISSRRIRELQILGCLIVEIFLAKQLRALGANNVNLTFTERLKSCLTIINSCKSDIPPCIAYVIDLLLQPECTDMKNFNYPSVTDFGLPPPSAHLLLEPLLHCIIPFNRHFPYLYELIGSLKEFKNIANELNVLYYFDCNGDKCIEFEHIEKTKILFAQNIGECKVKMCTKNFEFILTNDLNTTTDMEIVHILLLHIKELIEDPPTAVLAAWYLFDPIARVLGPEKTITTLLQSILKLYENEPNELNAPYNGKIAKLYHHSFLLRLIVRMGLRCFLDNFITPLVEAVGGYKDYENIDFILHTHSEKAVIKRTSHLKTMDTETIESASDDSSISSTSELKKKKLSNPPCEEMFEFDEENREVEMKSLMEQLELNVASDLPFNYSTAEEALDATLTENIEQLRNLEELNLSHDLEESKSGVTSPTIQIPSASYRRNEINNIVCEVGSKQSDIGDSFEKKSMFDYTLVSSSVDDSTKISTSTSSSTQQQTKTKTNRKQQDVKISEMSSDSLVWLSHRLGPVLTARYLSRNLLKMLTLCFVGKENLIGCKKDENSEDGDVSVAFSRVVGDENATKVLDCLASIAGLYGEQIILLQYIPHMSELILLCKRKLTPNLEGGLISCLALLKHIIPYLSDGALMDQLQDVLLKNILHPTVRLLGSTKYTFPSGHIARNVLARKYIDTLYILSIRMGSDMTKTLLAVPALQRFFLIFNKVHPSEELKYPEEKPSTTSEKESTLLKSIEESLYVEVKRDGTTAEWAVGGRPVQISHVRLKDSESVDSLSPPTLATGGDLDADDSITSLALNELRTVFTSELAHVAYVPFLKHIGVNSLEISLKNHDTIRELCQQYESGIKSTKESNNTLGLSDFNQPTTPTLGSSIGSNVAVIGNRLDVQNESIPNIDLLSLVSNRMENNSRHLRGNWLAYWEHEIGRSDKDIMFNFKQIKLQQFTGHTHSVKSLCVLDNENSFMSGSRDKTVKLWSLRSHGDGTSNCNCQWTYTAHKKSVLSLTFIDSLRLVASCDSIVHVWDPFMGVNLGVLESTKYSPVNALKSMPAPSTMVFAATTEGTIKVIDARLWAYIYELKISVNPSGLIRCLAVSASGLWLAAGQSSGNITILDTRTGLVISNWRAHESEVLQLVALDNNTIISSSLDQTISVWNINDGKFMFNMRGTMEPVHCLNVYNNELISGTTANRIGVHTSIEMDACFSSTKLRSDAFKGLLTSMAVLPLNRLLLLGADTGNINLLC